MVALVNVETIPFHFIWVSFTLVHGFWPWRRRDMLVILLGVCVATGAALAQPITDGQLDLQEVTEIPLMAAMFLAMAWHVERREHAVEVAQRLARRERHAWEREHEFVRDASHEIRSPITLARGHLELLVQAGLAPQQQADAEVVLSELDRLARMASGLLTIASTEQPDAVRRTPLDLTEELAQTLRRWSGGADRRWLLEVSADVRVSADPVRLQAALDALIENAVQHTGVGGLVALRLDQEPAYAVITVSDDGPGVPPEIRERIFERFYRGDGDRHAAGSGLGLAIAAAVARAHGGRIDAGQADQGGAQFSVRLPLQPLL